jgi:hypothetical protein
VFTMWPVPGKFGHQPLRVCGHSSPCCWLLPSGCSAVLPECELRQALLAAAAAVPGGCEVVRIQPEQLPEGFRGEHVELYELQLSA